MPALRQAQGEPFDKLRASRAFSLDWACHDEPFDSLRSLRAFDPSVACHDEPFDSSLRSSLRAFSLDWACHERTWRFAGGGPPR